MHAEEMTFDKTSWDDETNTVVLTAPTTISSATIEDLESWTLSFDWSYTKGTNSNKWGTTIFATGTDPFSSGATGGYAGGFQIRWNNGGGEGVADKNKNGVLFIVGNGQDNVSQCEIATIADFAETDYDFNFKISYDVDKKVVEFVVGYGDKEATGSFVSNSEVTLSSFSTGTADYKTVGSYSNLSGSYVVASVPEPSAFGLLAGIGALALVASRRRRK